MRPVVVYILVSISPAVVAADPAIHLAKMLAKSELVTVDRQGICLFDAAGRLRRIDRPEGIPRTCQFDASGRRMYLYQQNIVEVDRRTFQTRVIEVSPDISGRSFVVLPDSRFAILNNRSDQIYIVDDGGRLLHTVSMFEDAGDGHLQNVSGLVADDDLIICEDGRRQLLRMNLKTRSCTVFRSFSEQKSWLGQVVYHNRRFYVSTSTTVFSFAAAEDEPEEVVRMEQGNITGMVIDQRDRMFLMINFTGQLHCIDLNANTHTVLSRELNYPKGLTLVPEVRTTSE